MNAKRVLSFLVMRPAFTQRNMTSLLLVGVFIGAYVLMGGKVTTELPRPGRGSSFGAIDGAKRPAKPEQAADASAAQTEAEPERKLDPEAVLGAKPTADRRLRSRATMGFTQTSEEERAAAELETIDKEGLIKGNEFRNPKDEWRLKQSEKKPADSLDAIEERLRINRANN